VKFGGQGIGEDCRDLPACCSTPNREIDGFIGNLTEQSQEGTPWRQAVDFVRQPKGRVLNILDHFPSVSTFH
jgi:hypothetical protein